MLAPVAAVLAAFFFAASSLFTRIGLDRSNPATAAFIGSVVNVLTWWPLFFLLLPPSLLLSKAVLPFVIAGIAGPFLGRLTLYIGYERVGAALAGTIYNTQIPIAALGGVIFLQESVSLLGGVGILILLVGLTMVGMDPSAGNLGRPRRVRDLAFPVVSGFFFGSSYVLRKIGLAIVPEVVLALSVVSFSSLAGLYASAPLTRQRFAMPGPGSLLPLVVAGVFTSGGQLFITLAILFGDLSVVVPLQNTQPLFTVAMAALFLRKMERVTRYVVAGAVLIVMGGVMVNL